MNFGHNVEIHYLNKVFVMNYLLNRSVFYLRLLFTSTFKDDAFY